MSDLSERKPECIFCDAILEYNSEYVYYRCPNGCGEWWVDEKRLKEMEEKRQAVTERDELKKRAGQLCDDNGEIVMLWSFHRTPPEVLPAGPSKKGSGSRVKSRTKKKAPKKTRTEKWEEEMRQTRK